MGSYLISASRIKGRGHAQCDDRYYMGYVEGWFVAALADGAGSRANASLGAKRLTRAVCHLLPRYFTDGIGRPLHSPALERAKREFTEALQDTLRRVAVKEAVPFDSLASTLLFAAKHPSSPYWLLGQLGDGVLATVHANGRTKAALHPQNGEFANETSFLTGESAPERLRVIRRRAVGVAMMSDGSAHTLYSKSTRRTAPALATFARWQRELGSARTSTLLRRNIQRAIAPRTSDDCSLLMVQQWKKGDG